MKTEKHNNRKRLLDVVPLPQPYVIMIDPCGVCNFKCSFCPCNMTDDAKDLRHVIMDMSIFEKIVHDIKEFPDKIKAIDLYGFGEPLLNKNLPDMVRLLKEENVCDKVRMSTNASLLDRNMSEKLIDAGLDYIKVSLEALDDEGYEKLCGVKNQYDKIKMNIESYYALAQTCNKERYMKSETDVKKEGGGKSRIGVKIVSTALKSNDDKSRFFNIFEPISDYTFIENIKPIWADCSNIHIPENNYIDDYYEEHTRNYKICSYPLTNMLIQANGDIGVCCHDWKHGTTYANIKNMSLVDAWNSEKLKEIQKKHLEGRRNEIPFCSQCVQKGYDNVDNDAKRIIDKLG